MPWASSPPSSPSRSRSSTLVVVAMRVLSVLGRKSDRRGGGAGPAGPYRSRTNEGNAWTRRMRPRMDTRRTIDRFLASPSLADATRRSYRFDLEAFADWLEARKLGLDDVDVRVLSDYVTELGRGRPRLAPSTIARKVSSTRSLLRFALGPGRVPDAPLTPRRSRRLPVAPRADEVDTALDALDGSEPLPLRNRALVELLYSAGLRSREAVDLDLADVDFDQELVRVRGKGGKERVVPLGEEAAHWLARYVGEARPDLARGAASAFFLSARGRRLDTSTL